VNGVKMVQPAGYVIPVTATLLALLSGAAILVSVELVTNCKEQYWPVVNVSGPVLISKPASPKDCLSILLVIGVVYGYALKKASLHYFDFLAVLAASTYVIFLIGNLSLLI